MARMGTDKNTSAESAESVVKKTSRTHHHVL